MTRAELLERLTIERYGCNDWWTTPEPEVDDSETTTARRRREMARNFESKTERRTA